MQETNLLPPAPAAASTPLLDARHLTKHFSLGGIFGKSKLHALEDVSFTLDRARVLALVGESGSGKSTTARLIARLMPPTSGEIHFKGKDVLKEEARAPSLKYRS